MLIIEFYFDSDIFLFSRLGEAKLGLLQTCMTIYGRSQVCVTPQLHPEWMLTLICVILGAMCVTATIILLVASHYYLHFISYARWVGFTASEYQLFSLNLCYKVLQQNVFLKK